MIPHSLPIDQTVGEKKLDEVQHEQSKDKLVVVRIARISKDSEGSGCRKLGH